MNAPDAASPRSLRSDVAGLRRGSHTVADYVNELSDRIDEWDPRVRAFVDEPDRRARLLGSASKLSTEAAAGPLHGVPIGVKDVIRVDGFLTRAGSALMPEELAGDQAPAVSQLLDGGGLIAGKTVTAEFAMTAPGPTGNPRRLDHTPGGSSSGSAAAVAAGMVPLALGTQTLSSVVRPAAYCGIVGFKPTYGRVDIGGVIANSPSLDTLGWFTAEVGDAVLAAEMLCAHWRSDISVSRLPVLGIPDSRFLAEAGDDARRAFDAHVAILREAGFEVRHSTVLSDCDEVADCIFTINRWEFARTHQSWFGQHESIYRPETATVIRQGMSIAPADYADALRWKRDFTMRLARAVEDAQVDVWVAPAATRTAPPTLESTGNPVMGTPFTLAGVPALSIPAGYDGDGLPWGLQCVGSAGQDELLLAFGTTIEAALRAAS